MQMSYQYALTKMLPIRFNQYANNTLNQYATNTH